jgi:hypothetical protein
MNVGYAQGIITPNLENPVFLAGFGQNRRAETVHDDLYVRALAVSTTSCTLVLCALDLIGFFRRDVLAVTDRLHEIKPDVEILIASVHPHHGPDTMGLWGPDDHTSGIDPVYHSSLLNKIVTTILAALDNLNPVAGLKTTSVMVPGLVKNARNPEIKDEELTVAQFVNREGKPLVSFFNFPCHPEVLWEHNTHITADYPGVLRREVEVVTGNPCIFFSGALGGMMTPDVVDHSFEEAEVMGRTLAEAGIKALNGLPTHKEPISISRQTRSVNIKLTNILFKIAIKRGLFPDVRDKSGSVNTEVSLIRIGPLWLALLPGELLPKLGLVLKSEMRTAGAGVAGVISLANDELGYILPKEDFRYPLNPLKPGKHYEETMSINKEMGPAVLEAVRDLLHT